VLGISGSEEEVIDHAPGRSKELQKWIREHNRPRGAFGIHDWIATPKGLCYVNPSGAVWCLWDEIRLRVEARRRFPWPGMRVLLEATDPASSKVRFHLRTGELAARNLLAIAEHYRRRRS
jgi:hypothetical protein